MARSSGPSRAAPADVVCEAALITGVLSGASPDTIMSTATWSFTPP